MGLGYCLPWLWGLFNVLFMMLGRSSRCLPRPFRRLCLLGFSASHRAYGGKGKEHGL